MNGPSGKEISDEDLYKILSTNVGMAWFLTEMAAVYPGDPDGSIMKEVANLLGREYVEATISVY